MFSKGQDLGNFQLSPMPLSRVSYDDLLSDSEEMENGEEASSRSNFPCTDCDKSYKTQHSLLRHMAVHNEPAELRCEPCDIQFTEPYDLKSHNKLKHQFDRIECGICGQQFSSRSGRNSHIKMHFQEELHKCKECGKGFSSNSRLERHLVRHSKKSDFTCGICGHSYKYKSSLDRHTCKIPLPNHMCSVCGQIVGSKDALKNHERMHEPEGQFSCSKCEKVFRWRWSLNRHLQKCESGQADSDRDSVTNS